MTFEELIKSFKVQPELNTDFWSGENNTLNPKIRNALLKTAQIFYDSIELDEKPPIKDIVFTGSLANYNYSKFSDIDLHLIFDFKQFGQYKEVFETMFLLAKANWNNRHDIKVKGYEIEIYAEDEDNPHQSTGLYSVLDNQWIKTPQKQTPVFDPKDVKSKVDYFIKLYKRLRSQAEDLPPNELLTKVDALRDKIRKFRQSGLEQGGEFSDENIAFKSLRRIGLLDSLADFRDKLLDRSLSVENQK